jgi:hypothetical protein
MNQILDVILIHITKNVPEKWGGAVMIISFLVLLNLLDYLIHDIQTYGVVAAVFLIVWMLAGMRLTTLYQLKNDEDD